MAVHRIFIDLRRAKQLTGFRHKRDLVEELAGGRRTVTVSLDKLTTEEKMQLNGANFLKDPTWPCLLGTTKYDHHLFWIGEC